MKTIIRGEKKCIGHNIPNEKQLTENNNNRRKSRGKRKKLTKNSIYETIHRRYKQF